MIPHDPALCQCGHDTLAETAEGPACQCQCEDCTKRRQGVLYWWKIRRLEKRLEAAGINVEDLAALLWYKREQEFERYIYDTVEEAITHELENMRVVLRKRKHK